jgi:aminomethyltransferase
MMEINKTHLYEFHKANGHLEEYAGFEMPMWYDSIISEHLAVRNSVGIFDVTHMGRCLVDGRNAASFLDYCTTRDIASLSIAKGKYCLMCNEQGGIIDDLVIFRLDQNQFILIYNAVNRRKDFEWLNRQSSGFQVEIKDVSDNVAMFAVQGPRALSTLQPIIDVDLSGLRYFWGKWAVAGGQRVWVTRTSYTGEDGFELLLWNTPLSEPINAIRLWQKILDAGREFGIKPCGLGARDTLRQEAGLILYGNEINESITTFEAGLDFAVRLEKGDFFGKATLAENRGDKVKRIRVGLKTLNQRIPRSGNPIVCDEKEIGYVTSGTFSPLLKSGIGMGYVSSEHSQLGTKVGVRARQSMIPAEVVAMPFYDQTKYGRKRRV